jgi:hypothetical protein
MLRALLFITCLQLAVADEPSPVKVALLSEHNPGAWDSASNCTEGLGLVRCNLQVYSSALTIAAANGAELVLFPEAYALSGSTHGLIEPWVSPVGSTPCDDSSDEEAEGQSPAQVALSCSARDLKLTIVANIFVALPNGTNLIQDVVFDGNGTSIASYSKHHLFPSEIPVFSPGPYAPTVFKLRDNFVFGLIICFEGVWPLLSGDWSQMEDLESMGASHFAWSIGSDIPIPASSKLHSTKFGVGEIAAEDKWAGSVTDSSGSVVASTDIPLPAISGYSAGAAVRLSSLVAAAAR